MEISLFDDQIPGDYPYEWSSSSSTTLNEFLTKVSNVTFFTKLVDFKTL